MGAIIAASGRWLKLLTIIAASMMVGGVVGFALAVHGIGRVDDLPSEPRRRVSMKAGYLRSVDDVLRTMEKFASALNRFEGDCREVANEVASIAPQLVQMRDIQQGLLDQMSPDQAAKSKFLAARIETAGRRVDKRCREHPSWRAVTGGIKGN